MITLSKTYKEKIINELISNRLEIIFPDGEEENITEVNIESESMSLKQSICDDDKLQFGGCIASEFSITLFNTVDRTFNNNLIGKWIKVKLTQSFPSGNPLLPSTSVLPSDNMLLSQSTATQSWFLFNGIIKTADVDKADRNKRKIVAYDLISLLYEREASNKLFNLWKENRNTTYVVKLLELVENEIHKICNSVNSMLTETSLNDVLGETINEKENLTVRYFPLYNEVWLNNSDNLSYGLLLKNICEMLGVFLFVSPSSFKGGTVKYMKLGSNSESYDFYEDLYEYEIKPNPYTGVMFSVGGTDRPAKTTSFDIKSETNLYNLTKNILVWQNNDNTGWAWVHKFENLFNGNPGTRICNSSYSPIEATLDGRLWVEVGDKIKIKTYVTDADGNYLFNDDGTVKTKIVESYVLSREITGIQALTDKITAKGA